MTREEFLAKLKEALENDLSGSIVTENINYYHSYITDEVNKGRSEREVIEELGDPWVIARSVIDMAETGQTTGQESSGYHTTTERTQSQNTGNQKMYSFGLDSWWKKLLLVLCIVGILIVILVIVGGLFSIFIRFAIPILLIVLIVRLIGGGRR